MGSSKCRLRILKLWILPSKIFEAIYHNCFAACSVWNGWTTHFQPCSMQASNGLKVIFMCCMFAVGPLMRRFDLEETFHNWLWQFLRTVGLRGCFAYIWNFRWYNVLFRATATSCFICEELASGKCLRLNDVLENVTSLTNSTQLSCLYKAI